MDDLISRRDAVNELREYITEPSISDDESEIIGYNDGIELAISVLSTMPSAQKKGHWRNYEGTLTCSVCEAEFDNGIMEYCGDDVPMFCPDCGAEMRGDDDG